MKSYEDIVAGYKKRRKETLVDTLATSLTYVDDVVADTGALEEASVLGETVSAVCTALPFVIIAAMEGTKAIVGGKPAKNAARDAAGRMVKTGLALGAGALAAGALGFWAAVPTAMGTRVLVDRCKSRSLEGMRVHGRIDRLKNLREQIGKREEAKDTETVLPADPLEATGAVT